MSDPRLVPGDRRVTPVAEVGGTINPRAVTDSVTVAAVDRAVTTIPDAEVQPDAGRTLVEAAGPARPGAVTIPVEAVAPAAKTIRVEARIPVAVTTPGVGATVDDRRILAAMGTPDARIRPPVAETPADPTPVVATPAAPTRAPVAATRVGVLSVAAVDPMTDRANHPDPAWPARPTSRRFPRTPTHVCCPARSGPSCAVFPLTWPTSSPPTWSPPGS